MATTKFGEDPSINLLQERAAALLGKEAALWFPTGTMANQAALRALTRPGDDVIVSQEAHSVWHEAGASAANAGVQFTAIGARGVFTRDEFVAAIKPRGHMLYPATTLVEVENTHNRSGGIVFPRQEAVAAGLTPAQCAAPFDLVSVAFSKGLGAPAGSLLAGSKETIQRCVRCRRTLGGAMRQVGLLAAAALYALDHNMTRLAEDHAHARLIAEKIATSERILVDLATVQTNIIVFRLAAAAPNAAEFTARARERGLLVSAFGPRTIRAVAHLDVTRQQCERAAQLMLEIVAG